MTKSDTRLLTVMDIPVALVLLTRLPLPSLPQSAFARQARAAWAYPFAGLAVALPACVLGWGAVMLGLNAAAAAGVMLGVQILLTGAMHEDGLADTADGFWGGYTTGRRLEIMKDSQIGTYGVLALILSLGLRWITLTVLANTGSFALIIAVAILARALMLPVMAALPHARTTGLSHDVGRPGWRTVGLGVLLALLLAFGLGGSAIWLAGLAAALSVWILAQIARSKINGQTGDVLGACQQTAEVILLLMLTAQT
jgi:adenosylcobinamide-GDP ribazoletransferase